MNSLLHFWAIQGKTQQDCILINMWFCFLSTFWALDSSGMLCRFFTYFSFEFFLKTNRVIFKMVHTFFSTLQKNAKCCTASMCVVLPHHPRRFSSKCGRQFYSSHWCSCCFGSGTVFFLHPRNIPYSRGQGRRIWSEGVGWLIRFWSKHSYISATVQHTRLLSPVIRHALSRWYFEISFLPPRLSSARGRQTIPWRPRSPVRNW